MSSPKAPQADLSPAEIRHCHQYCVFLGRAGRQRQYHKEIARAFLSRHPLPETMDFPREWLTNESARDQAAGRFMYATEDLQSPASELTVATAAHSGKKIDEADGVEQQVGSWLSRLSSWSNLLWIFSVSLVGNILLRMFGVKG